MINEIRLRPVPGYGTDYWASNDGRVFSMKYDKLRELKAVDDCNKSGPRLCVQLSFNGKRKTFSVHRLVAMAFDLPKGPGAVMIRHYDGDYKNNIITNLIWGTAKENAEDRVRHAKEREEWTEKDEKEAEKWT